MKKMVSEKIPTLKYNLLYRSGNQRYFCADTHIVKTGSSIFAVHLSKWLALGKEIRKPLYFVVHRLIRGPSLEQSIPKLEQRV